MKQIWIIERIENKAKEKNTNKSPNMVDSVLSSERTLTHNVFEENEKKKIENQISKCYDANESNKHMHIMHIHLSVCSREKELIK